MTETKLDEFTLAYIECALWSSTDDNGDPLDGNFGVEDISEQAMTQILEDCKAFQESETSLLSLSKMSAGYCGHDFWLTRNRHGAGFCDRGLGEVGRQLTDSAHAYGDCNLYVGDDGKLYI